MNNNHSLTHNPKGYRPVLYCLSGTGDYMCSCSMYILSTCIMSGHSLYCVQSPWTSWSSTIRVGQLPNKEIGVL